MGLGRLIGSVKGHIRRSKRAAEERRLDAEAVPNPRPIFVMGNQKSGTTAIGRLLAERIGGRYSNDMIYTRRWQDLRDILSGRVEVAEMVSRAKHEFAADVIKDPNFAFCAPELAAYFPGAQFVFILREPAGNIKSILDRLDLPGDQPHIDLEAPVFQQASGWRAMFEPGGNLGLPGESHIDLLALRWVKAAEAAEIFDGPAEVVRYEDFLADKAGFLDRLAKALGRETPGDVTHLLDRQFQPKGKRSETVEAFFGPDNLAAIERITGDVARRHGYGGRG
jgi:hypothetical protein